MSRAKDRVRAWLRRHPATVSFCLFTAFGLSIDRAVPWTDDARFYVPAARAQGEWLLEATVGLASLDTSAFSRGRLDAAFQHNHEHPPVGKYVMALSWLVTSRLTGLLDAVSGCRLGVTLLWAWMCALVLLLVAEQRGLGAGVFAGLALALMPRVLFHGQVETLDLPVTALLVITFERLWRSLERPSVVTTLTTILCFGLALGTKLNAPFFLVAALGYWLVLWPPVLRRTGFQLGGLPLVVIGMAVLSPLLTFALWPWLWFDTLARLNAYLLYHLQHYGILLYFRGVIYGDAVAPWYAPFILAGLTVPVCVLVLALAGAGRPLAAALAHWRALLRRQAPLARLDHRDPALRLGLLALLAALTQLAAVSLPGVPVYGGEKLFLPAFPFIALLAGLCFGDLAASLRLLAVAARTQRWLVAAAFCLLLSPSAVGVLAYRGNWLSYYNELVGGVRGAAAAGYERQYYDLAYPQLAEDLSRLLPDGGSVAILPNPKEYAPYFARWQEQGRLARTIRRQTPEAADLVVLTHEQRWREYPTLVAHLRTLPVVARREIAGVPLYLVYDRRPRPAPRTP